MMNVAESPYNAVITKEQFMFYEVRTMAKLLSGGCSREEAVDRIVSNNLFQYPTEKCVRQMALASLKRLDALGDSSLVKAIATHPFDVAKQICLYAMMREYRLVMDFMVTVIGEKYRTRDTRFEKIDLNCYFLRLQEQDDKVATWSDSTISKLKQVIKKVLVENEYLANTKATTLQPTYLYPVLEEVIRANGDEIALSAFGSFA